MYKHLFPLSDCQKSWRGEIAQSKLSQLFPTPALFAHRVFLLPANCKEQSRNEIIWKRNQNVNKVKYNFFVEYDVKIRVRHSLCVRKKC